MSPKDQPGAESLQHELTSDETLLDQAILAYFKAEDAGLTLDPHAWMSDYPATIQPAMKAFLAKHLATRQIWQTGLWVSPAEESGVGFMGSSAGDDVADRQRSAASQPVDNRPRRSLILGTVIAIVVIGLATLWAGGIFR